MTRREFIVSAVALLPGVALAKSLVKEEKPIAPYIRNTGKGLLKFRYRGGRVQTLRPGEWFNCEKGDFYFYDDTPPYLQVISGDGVEIDGGGNTFIYCGPNMNHPRFRAVPLASGTFMCGNP